MTDALTAARSERTRAYTALGSAAWDALKARNAYGHDSPQYEQAAARTAESRARYGQAQDRLQALLYVAADDRTLVRVELADGRRLILDGRTEAARIEKAPPTGYATCRVAFGRALWIRTFGDVEGRRSALVTASCWATPMRLDEARRWETVVVALAPDGPKGLRRWHVGRVVS